MKKILSLMYVLLLRAGVGLAANPYLCGTNRIAGILQTSDPENTIVTVSLKRNGVVMQDIIAAVEDDGRYEVFFDESIVTDGLYIIDSVATLSGTEARWTYQTYIGSQCGVCGNGLVDDAEQCETDAECGDGFTCSECKCVNTDEELTQRIRAYANEVADFQKNQSEQVVPSTFIATGGPFAFVDSIIKKVGITFAGAKSAVYTTVPSWTLDPMTDIKNLTLESFYAVLPKEYQNKDAYFHFKGLFVPLLTAGKDAKPEHVLEKLNQGAVLAPETPSVNTIGAVKMLYTHAASLTPSSFAGIGSYISVFGEVGDSFTIYVKSSIKKYEKRTYTIKSKFQIKPDQTKILNTFAKEGIDSYALITCRDGNILGSTKAREIILADRKKEELGKFQKTMIALGDDKKLALAKKKIDEYLAKKDLSEEQVKSLVNKLDQVADKGKGNPLSVIATYGKYMTAYDAVYADGALGG